MGQESLMYKYTSVIILSCCLVETSIYLIENTSYIHTCMHAYIHRHIQTQVRTHTSTQAYITHRYTHRRHT